MKFMGLLLNYCRLNFIHRSRFSRIYSFLILCIFCFASCLLFNQQLSNEKIDLNQLNREEDLRLFINRIRNIAILDQNHLFNITYSFTFDGIPKWINQYGITHLFNFYWLQNGAYLWHLQRMFDLQHISLNRSRRFHQTFRENYNQSNLFDYLNYHPEYGIIIDTALDPIQPLFPPLPQTSLTFEQTSEYSQWLNTLQLSQINSKNITSSSFKPLVTYALYDVTIDVCEQCRHSTDMKINHYEEMIFLFDCQEQITDEMIFIQQILPRLIRLLALIPDSAAIILPYLNSRRYVSRYLDVLIERGLIKDRKRLIEYNSNEIYHANVIYSTSSPRSDLILLNRVLLGDKPPVRRELILILRHGLDNESYHQIVQTIDLFELPEGFEYVHIDEYNEQSFDLKEVSDLFQQARIIIGMPTSLLSHIVWCLPHTHIIEIFQQTNRKDFYEMIVQLQLNYWLVMRTKSNRIDVIDFRNLMMKVLIDIDA